MKFKGDMYFFNSEKALLCTRGGGMFSHYRAPYEHPMRSPAQTNPTAIIWSRLVVSWTLDGPIMAMTSSVVELLLATGRGHPTWL